MEQTKKDIKSTNNLDQLLNKVSNLTDLEDYIVGNLIPEFDSLSHYLNYMLQEKNLTKSEVITEANLDRTYTYQIFSGLKSKPDRDRVIAICIAMKLNIEETSRALAIGGLGKLYSKNTRDAVLIYAINKRLSVSDTENLLNEFGEDPFSFMHPCEE